jgi:uncharacterized protein YqeY
MTRDPEGLCDAKIQRMLRAMIKQRRESITLFEQANVMPDAERARGSR